MDKFLNKIGRPYFHETTVPTLSGRIYTLRELSGLQVARVDRHTLPEDVSLGVAKRVAASIVSINGVAPTDLDLTILANFGGAEMDELVSAYIAAFDADFVQGFKQTKKYVQEVIDYEEYSRKQRESDG